MPNIILTGLPRSGTTLVCHLLNKVPNAVALHEPMQPNRLKRLPAEELVGSVAAFFESQRRRVLQEGKATSKASKGGVPPNPLGDAEFGGQRQKFIDGMEILVSNVDRQDFCLYIKHPSFFTACLPLLAPRMECFAVIRNPLSVLLSWRNAGMAVTNGRVPAAEAFDPDLSRLLDAQPDILRRQLHLIDYFFRRFADYLPGRVVRYEDVIVTGGRALARVCAAAESLDEPLSSRNTRAVGKDAHAHKIANMLLEDDNACWSFYRREDVENLFRDPA
ncbi:MAG: sulfotransferase [Beijerinckiaceae bacterium]|nr:sulfotransferase [Beijerinckiaceae bacterium]